MNKKITALILTMLMCLTTIVIPKNSIVSASSGGKTLYVGGRNFGNYSYIQDAIDDATSGNTTIFVYDGNYFENLIIKKTINLTSERNDAIIDGDKNGSAVLITADWVNLTGFTIQNGGGEENDAGIKIISNHVNISNNIIRDCDAQGVYLEQASNNTLWNNTFTNIVNTSTIFLWNSSNYNTIKENTIQQCGCAIEIGNGSSHNNISDNIIDNNTYGIYLWINATQNNSISKNIISNTTCDGLRIEEAVGNKVFENWFENNDIGISIFAVNSTTKNSIYHNNFINNTEHFLDESNQSWDNGYPSGGNYWDDYDGSDEFSGINQNITGSDGFGDSPYLEWDNVTIDFYPLLCYWGEYYPVAVYGYAIQNMVVSYNGSDSYDCDGDIVNWTWSFGDTSNGYGETTSRTYTQNGAYNVSLKVRDNMGKNNTFSDYVVVGNDSQLPVITSVSNSPETVGFGYNVNISANVTDNFGVDIVIVNIIYPDASYENFTMTHTSGNNYRYEFADTWRNGEYNYTIWAVDHSNNSNSSDVFDFTVSSQATISVCTVKDNYGDNEYINLTDPPGNPLPSLGYELLGDGAVLHLWNQYDSYYFNTSSGIQLTNHNDDYWSHNILMLGYYNNDQWHLVYRTDELTGFTKDIETDNASFVNVTLWKDLSYGGYSFRLAIRYHLGVDDNDLTVIPYIKNIGANTIPYVLGFGWELKDIQINMTSSGDYIVVDQDRYFLNQTLDNSYTSLNDTVFYLMEDVAGPQTQSLYLRWNPDLTYKLQVKSRSGQQNAPVTLFIRVGTLASGQQKQTVLQWYDASQETFYFNAFDENVAWEQEPERMTDEDEGTSASTSVDGDEELCNENTCDGEDRGGILKVELRVNGYNENGQGNITLRPVFGGNQGDRYTFITSGQPEWSEWFDITDDEVHEAEVWNWSEVHDLGCLVISTDLKGILFCSKVELRVTYNTAPSVSNPSPPYGFNGITLQPWLNITVSDPNGDAMNVTWYSNSTSRLLMLRPNANGSSTQLERYPTSQNANYQCVDETNVNDSDYVKWCGTTWKKDTYNLADHGNASGVIHGVTVYVRCGCEGYGSETGFPNTGKIILKSGNGYYHGNELVLSSTFTSYDQTWLLNPATGSAWTWSAIDALQAGINLTGDETGTSRCSQVYVVVQYTDPSTWLQIGGNNSVYDGVYQQRFLNASMNGQWWYWKVKAEDGNASTWSSVYKFYTGYQSKIENTGETNIKGCLQMQVQYYNETLECWVMDNDTINEDSPRVINIGAQFGMDTIFNGIINTWNLSRGNETYRIYVAFRDPNGNVIQINDSSFLNASYEFNVSMNLDSDDDGWTDYDEIMLYSTDPNDEDDDNDGVLDPDDIDPLTDLEVNVTIKRVYANKYSYTWCEGENLDWSVTNTSGLTGGSAWTIRSSSEASGGYYTRQNDDREGFDDIAEWDFTVLKPGIYYFWMRSYRNSSACSNVYLSWKNDTGSYRIYDRKWDDRGFGYEVSWWQNTTEEGEWKWSWYGVLQLQDGDEGTLNITNIPENKIDYPEYPENSTRGNHSEYWMEVDNILITDDPSCCPSGKGIEDSDDHTIGTNIYYAFDPMPPELPAPDFYINVTIGETCVSSQDELGTWWDDDDVLDDWSAVVDVSDEKGNEDVSITLELYDEDGAEDYQVDICADPTRKTCGLTYNLENATWWGDDHLMDTDFLGRTCGEVDGSGWTNGDVVFEISQNDNDGDHITYWQESKDGPYKKKDPIILDDTNEKRAMIVGAGASCILRQENDNGSLSYQWPHFFYQGPHFVYQGGYSWTDYTFEVDMESREFWPDLNNEEIGVMFRYQDEDNYYLLRWKENGMRDWMYLDKVEDGDWENLAKERAYLSKLDWYTLRIILNGDDIQVDLNNNRNDKWTTKIEITDTGSTLESGTVALWCWKNRQAWFDDVLVYNSDSDILLSDGFDYGKVFRWNVVNDPSGESEWNLTIRCVDQEDFYVMPDFVYRILLLVGHYEKDNIYYLSAARWRDADGDGENDVTNLSTKENVRYGLSTWLSQSLWKDFNLVYIFDHGSFHSGIFEYSLFSVDDIRNGEIDPLDSITDVSVDRWLPRFTYTPIVGHGRLTFVIEACMIGHFNTKIVGGNPFQHRIAISSTSKDRSAAPETGQDWPSFTHMLFKSMANGRTSFLDAFKTADYHVSFINFMSRWAPTKIAGEWTHVAQDGKLNDNGDTYDSDWDGGLDGELAGKTGI